MKAMRGRWMKTRAALIAGLGLWSLAVTIPATQAQGVQTIDARDLIARLQRLERDMRDLQAETFRRAPGAPPQAPPANAPPSPAPEPQAQQAAMPDLNPLMRRLGDLEESLGRLTGQMEELGHQVDQLSQRTDRLQKQMDLQQAMPAANAEMPAVAGDPPPRPADSGNAVASLAPDQNAAPLRGPPPANLGQIPAGAPLPAPSARPADPKREFDAAMNLLSRAQYDPASDAFRKFADAHPDEDRASDALYWTGDIA